MRIVYLPQPFKKRRTKIGNLLSLPKNKAINFCLLYL